MITMTDIPWRRDPATLISYDFTGKTSRRHDFVKKQRKSSFPSVAELDFLGLCVKRKTCCLVYNTEQVLRSTLSFGTTTKMFSNRLAPVPVGLLVGPEEIDTSSQTLAVNWNCTENICMNAAEIEEKREDGLRGDYRY